MFTSEFEARSTIQFPQFSGTRIMMLPVLIGVPETLPRFVEHYTDTFKDVCANVNPVLHGDVGYLTIDEKTVKAGASHRRGGLHVDGVYGKMGGAWGGSRQAPWASIENGMLLASSVVGCRAWNQQFAGDPGEEGECDHLLPECDSERETLLEANRLYWMSPMCVHESLPMQEDTRRQLLRLSLPSDAPWFEGYTENPLGIIPTGPILPRRPFMDA